MKLYFKDTERSYGDISDLLTSHIGPAGPETWQNGVEKDTEYFTGYYGYVEIYNTYHPGSAFVILKW